MSDNVSHSLFIVALASLSNYGDFDLLFAVVLHYTEWLMKNVPVFSAKQTQRYEEICEEKQA